LIIFLSGAFCPHLLARFVERCHCRNNMAVVDRRRLLPCLLYLLAAATTAFCPRFLPPLESMAPAEAGHEASTEGALPCFPLPLQRAALPWSKRTLNIMESRYQKMYRDLLAQGARRVVVPRYVLEKGTKLAEAAVVFNLVELKDAPPGARFRYQCHHQVLPEVVRITRVVNPEAFAKKKTYLKVECQEISDLDLEEDLSNEQEQLREALLQLAALGKAIGSPPLRRYEYMSDSIGRCHLVDHGQAFPEAALNLASARRGQSFWELAELWLGYSDRRAVALRQQHDRHVQKLRSEGGSSLAMRELKDAFEEELQEHWSQNADAMQVLLQCDRHGDRVALLHDLIQRETRRVAALGAVAASTGREAQA